MSDDSDLCNCGAPYRRGVVQKDGPNKGRPYKGCPLPRESQCENSFRWDDAQPTFAPAGAYQNNSNSNGGAQHRPAKRPATDGTTCTPSVPTYAPPQQAAADAGTTQRQMQLIVDMASELMTKRNKEYEELKDATREILAKLDKLIDRGEMHAAVHVAAERAKPAGPPSSGWDNRWSE
jgi:hypothetical protein